MRAAADKVTMGLLPTRLLTNTDFTEGQQRVFNHIL